MGTTALGIIAASWAVVMALSPLLQIREILRRGSSEGVSIGYFAILLIGFGLWICYGITTRDVPLVVPNCVAALVMGCTIAVALAWRRASGGAPGPGGGLRLSERRRASGAGSRRGTRRRW
jgi:MtN3 and saliva related transmembrane protein